VFQAVHHTTMPVSSSIILHHLSLFCVESFLFQMEPMFLKGKDFVH
jgi:hypothetical protein